jgi:uncharacterized protein YndB with AHSA1/START domain
MSIAPNPDRTLVLTRTIHAPIERVFEALSRPARLMHGWDGGAPHVLPGTEGPVESGHYRFRVRATDGTEHRVRGTFIHLVRPRRLNFTWLREDAAGEVICDTVVAITLEEHGGRTTLTLEQTAFATAGQQEEHLRGWTEWLERCARTTAQDEVVHSWVRRSAYARS